MQKISKPLCLLLIVLATLGNTTAAGQADEWLVLSDLNLFDGTGTSVRHVPRLVARNGVIVALGEEGADPGTGEPVTQIDLGGAFVMPGLIDAHVHLSGFPGDRESMPQRMQAALRGGVTSVRDMAGDARVLQDTERAMLRGEFVGLTIASSALFGGPGMFTDPRVGNASIGYAPGTAPWQQSVTNETDLPLAIAAARAVGADGIKIYGNLNAPLIRKLSAEAHRQHLKVWAHSTVFPAAPEDLLDAGADVLSHAPYLIWAAVDDVPDDYGARRNGPYQDIAVDDPKIEALLERMAASQIILDTTLLIYRDAIQAAEGQSEGAWAQHAFRWGVSITRLAHELGVPLAAGTDRFTRDEDAMPDIHGEMRILVNDAGLAPAQALLAATATAARAAGLDASRGTLEVGKAADIVVLAGNPLENISATEGIVMVIKDGRVVHLATQSVAAP